ncbi:MAG: hypothetical protein JXB48_24270, partial [Candidatus Latescibacteria bacterium]|nr:hypothetical protein [Candidatus Latescibacterota bacterium]
MRWMTFICIAAFILICGVDVYAEPVSTSWSVNSETIYDTGFMHMLMKHPDGGVCLFNMDLTENDSPGGGYSEKGVFNDIIWGDNHARKILTLEDIRAKKAYLIILFGRGRNGKHPLLFSVNGHKTQMEYWDPKTCSMGFRWIEFPAEWLKKGKNVIDLSCPEAKMEQDGWNIWLSRADEFEHGGGDPADVGETSFKSTDGGNSWKKSPFGPDEKTRAEYTIRISLDRYVQTGWLASPVIDLWKGDSDEFIVPIRVFKKMNIRLESDVPNGTSVEYFLRAGTSPDPFSSEWEPYTSIGSGASIEIELTDRQVKGRFVQLKAELFTTNPLKSSILKSAAITAELLQGNKAHTSLKTTRATNPVIGYPSVQWEWEKWDRPEFQELKKRENLDGIIAGSKTQFETMIRL